MALTVGLFLFLFALSHLYYDRGDSLKWESLDRGVLVMDSRKMEIEGSACDEYEEKRHSDFGV